MSKIVPFSRKFGQSPEVNDELGVLLQRVDYLVKSKNIKTISFLSELPQEGKSHFVAILSYYFARIYSRNILIVEEGELYSETIDKLRPVPTARKYNKDHPYVHSSVCEGIDLFEFTKFNDSSTSSSSSLVETIESIKDAYSLILIDTSLSSITTNKSPLALGADGCILVKSEKSLDQKKYNQVQTLIKRKKMDLLGIVYNQMD